VYREDTNLQQDHSGRRDANTELFSSDVHVKHWRQLLQYVASHLTTILWQRMHQP